MAPFLFANILAGWILVSNTSAIPIELVLFIVQMQASAMLRMIGTVS